MKIPLLFLALAFYSNFTFGQEVLDIDKLKNCELFPSKGEFDNSQRLQKVKELKDELITVFLLKRSKKNIIKNSYTGKIDYTLIEKDEELGKEHSVEVIAIRLEPENGSYRIYLPHTNLKYYRLYKASCLNKTN